MIVYDLQCRPGEHRFEGWFKSSEDFEQQQKRGLLACPACGSVAIHKAVQAPRLARKTSQLPSLERQAPTPQAPVANAPLPPQALELVNRLAQLQSEALKSSRYVGGKFAEDARAMHYGEREHEVIHGQASPEEARELVEEGIAITPLPFPVVPPEQAN